MDRAAVRARSKDPWGGGVMLFDQNLNQALPSIPHVTHEEELERYDNCSFQEWCGGRCISRKGLVTISPEAGARQQSSNSRSRVAVIRTAGRHLSPRPSCRLVAFSAILIIECIANAKH